MSTIVTKGTIQHGRIEIDEPIDLPDGAQVTVSVATKSESDELAAILDDTPEGIAAWLNWYDSLKPLQMSEAEEAQAQAWLKKCSERDLAKLSKDAEDAFP